MLERELVATSHNQVKFILSRFTCNITFYIFDLQIHNWIYDEDGFGFILVTVNMLFLTRYFDERTIIDGPRPNYKVILIILVRKINKAIYASIYLYIVYKLIIKLLVCDNITLKHAIALIIDYL